MTDQTNITPEEIFTPTEKVSVEKSFSLLDNAVHALSSSESDFLKLKDEDKAMLMQLIKLNIDSRVKVSKLRMENRQTAAMEKDVDYGVSVLKAIRATSFATIPLPTNETESDGEQDDELTLSSNYQRTYVEGELSIGDSPLTLDE